jgi:hypothetical protein
MKTYFTALAAIVLAGVLVYLAEAQAATCQATGSTLSVAVQNFNTTCNTTYDKTKGHDCDPVSGGYLCTGEFADPDPDPDPELTMVPVCKETGSTLTIAEGRYDEACQPYRECAQNTETGKFDCVGYTIQNAIAPEPDPLPSCTGKPTLVNPLVINLVAGANNPKFTDANGRDVVLNWPAGIVTTDTIEIRDARHIVSIGGDFRPAGVSNDNVGALELRDQRAGGVSYLERMYIDITNRRFRDEITQADPGSIKSITTTGDAIDLGGVVPYDFITPQPVTTNPDFYLVKSILTGISGQHPPGCANCSHAHADGFEFVGPSGKVVFKDVHVSSNYQSIFVAPHKNFHGLYLEPHEQNTGGITFDNVTATLVEPPNLTTQQQSDWRFRANSYYMEAYNLRQENRQSCFDIDIAGDGKLYLETPSTESGNWLNFMGGKTVLHTEVSPGVATFDDDVAVCDAYVTDPNDRLIKGRSPNIPLRAEVGPGSEPICE